MIGKLFDLIFPTTCPVCCNGSDSLHHNPICKSCWGTIQRYKGPACRICGIPAISEFTGMCEHCMKTEPPFSRILYWGIFEGALRESIHLLKFNSIKRLSKPLGLFMSELQIPEVDCIVPVPLHRDKLFKRGFNQTAALGSVLSEKIGAPLELDILIKERDTLPQTDVTGKERLQNIRNAFSTSKSINGLRILLVDDVITTGATVRECSKVLIKAGAQSVVVAALARSMPRH